MPDNWSFVLAAYALAAVALLGYWRMLARREKDLEAQTVPPSGSTTAKPGERSHAASIPGHPRSEPTSRHPLQ